MPRTSQKIEQNMKRIFAGYLNPSYPRVLVARTVLQTDYLPTESPFYNYGWDYRYPETVAQEDRFHYAKGMYAVNEWATNYATRYYFTHTSKTPLTKSLRQLYTQAADALFGKAPYHQAYKHMAEVSKAAQATKNNFDHATFQALFQHDFTVLNALIANTPILEATNLDALAVAIGKQVVKPTKGSTPYYTHLIEKTVGSAVTAVAETPTDSSVKRSFKRTGKSLIQGGQFVMPGVAEVGIAAPIVAPVATILEGAALGEIERGLAVGGATLGTTAAIFAFTTIHETVHGYSTSDDHVGLIPEHLYSPPPKTDK